MPADWLPREWNYVARLVVVSAAIAWAWRRWLPMRFSLASIGAGVVAGLIGCAAWVALLNPFVEGGEPWSVTGWWLRFAAAVLLVPLFEEQLMRGFVLRFGTQWQETKNFDATLDEKSIYDVPAGAMNMAGVALSTALFTLGHGMVEWPASVVYGLLMCALYRWRKDMTSVVVAHAVTNAALAIYVVQAGAWQLW
ncbi:MAG: CPBP family glutamic-type intramembrane protease [Planctomycetota bacterium]